MQKDEQLLAGLGYKQEFKRAFSPLEVFGIAFSIIGIFPSLATTLEFSLPNGGPVSLVWGWTVCAFFIMAVALSLGELASAAPTSGGLYFWTYKYASPRWRNLLSWIVAYCNTMGFVAGVGATVWGCAVQLMAAVSIGSNLTFTPTTGQIFAVFVALLIIAGIVASVATRSMARLQWFYCALNVILCLVVIIGLPAATPVEYKNTAEYAFGGFENLNGWTGGFAFILGFLAPLWTSGGFDGPIHMSEEASNASVVVPWAVVSSNGISLILGWGLVVSIAFSMGTDIEIIMASPIGQPMAAILFNSFGKKGTLVVWALVVLAQFMGVTSALTSCSRQMFAFSRDGGLPFSRYLYRINRRTQTPVNCVWASIFCMFLLGLLVFAGPTVINAIFSLGVVGQYIAFGLPIASRFLGGTPWRPGPFTLGKMGLPVSFIALLWIAFSIVIVMFPSTPNPTAQSMNYTVVVGGAWIILCLTYYYFPRYGGRYWFCGPISNLQTEDTEFEEKASASTSEKELGSDLRD